MLKSCATQTRRREMVVGTRFSASSAIYRLPPALPTLRSSALAHDQPLQTPPRTVLNAAVGEERRPPGERVTAWGRVFKEEQARNEHQAINRAFLAKRLSAASHDSGVVARNGKAGHAESQSLRLDKAAFRRNIL